MADEAEVVEEQEEVVETPEPEATDPMDEFNKFLSAAGAATDEPEQELGDDDAAAEQDSGEEPTEEQPAPVTPTSADGPSFLMKQEAARAGIPEALIASAPDDAHLQWLMEGVRQVSGQQPEAEEAEPEPAFKVELPDDEYGPEDPVRKQFQSLVDQLNRLQQEAVAAKKEAAEAKSLHEKRQMDEAFAALFTPFDEVLDSYESPKFGNAKAGLTQAQYAARKAVADRYQGLGATVDTPAEEKRRLAELALVAFDPASVESKNKRQQQASRQRQSILGGAPSRPKPKAGGVDEATKLLDDMLAGKRPFALDAN